MGRRSIVYNYSFLTTEWTGVRWSILLNSTARWPVQESKLQSHDPESSTLTTKSHTSHYILVLVALSGWGGKLKSCLCNTYWPYATEYKLNVSFRPRITLAIKTIFSEAGRRLLWPYHFLYFVRAENVEIFFAKKWSKWNAWKHMTKWFVRLWFQFLNRAMRRVPEQNTSLHIASTHSASENV